MTAAYSFIINLTDFQIAFLRWVQAGCDPEQARKQGLLYYPKLVMSTKTLADKGFILAGKPDAEPMYTMTQKGGKLIELIDLEKPRKDFSKY
jgi:hypothetical protein